MNELIDYIKAHADRGACQCGKCFVIVDGVDGEPDLAVIKNPEKHQPIGHTADMIFFKVGNGVVPAKADDLRKLVIAHKGEFNDVNLFDGKEHNYLELGGWIGDQGLALTLMGLGALLGLWRLHTPKTLLGDDVDPGMAMQMAGSGLVTISAPKEA